MRLFIARHGQTPFNAEHRYLGALDPALNANGIAQAKALISNLPTSVDAIVCSPLRRAFQTADIIGDALGLQPCVHTAFRERHVGVFEGLTQAEAQTKYPDLWAQNITRQWHAAPTGGETIAKVVQRVTAGLQELSKQYRGQVVLLVAHGFVAKVIRATGHAGYDDFFNWQLNNGAVLEVETSAPIGYVETPQTGFAPTVYVPS